MYGLNTEEIIGAAVFAIHINEDRLVFETSKGIVAYEVDGDCCSRSYFFDFYGVRNLLDNGPVTAFEEVHLSPGDPGYRADTWEKGAGWSEGEYEDVKVYGFRFTTSHPMFGDVSSVVSFRNSSNGYYGGDMRSIELDSVPSGMLRLQTDLVEFKGGE
jgi:hypothetical protein